MNCSIFYKMHSDLMTTSKENDKTFTDERQLVKKIKKSLPIHINE